jgi:hypothetical protein
VPSEKGKPRARLAIPRKSRIFSVERSSIVASAQGAASKGLKAAVPGGQEVHQTGVNGWQQLFDGSEPTSNQLCACLSDQGLHLGVLLGIILPFDEDQAVLAKASGLAKLSVSGDMPPCPPVVPFPSMAR